MNGGRKRRFPVIVAISSILVLAISVVTAQQVFDGNRQVAFVRRQPQFQQQPNQILFQQNRNFVRQPQQFQQRQPFMIQQRQQQFRFQQPTQPFQRIQRVQQFQRTPIQNQQFRMRQGTTRAPFSPIRPPLSPMPFGSVQRNSPSSSSLRRPSNRSSLRLSTPPQTLIITTTPLPIPSSSPIPTTTEIVSLPSTTHSSSIHSVGGSLRRPIRVQQLQLNVRRKPQMTRGQFRRPQSNSKFPLTRHQPTHRVTKPDRVTRPIVSTTTEPVRETTETVSLTVAGTTPEGIQRESNDLKKVDDIEAAILQALIESSSPQSPPSTTHRPRIHRIRPGNRHRPSASPRVDAIEEAVLRAVLEATPSIPDEITTNSIEETTTQLTITEEPTTGTTQKSESTSLFPAFANRRHGHRRPTTINQIGLETTTIPTTSSTTEESTTESTTTTSEEPTTIVTEGTTTESVTDITIALPEESFEDINEKVMETENHQLHQIEENIISALSTPTSTTISPSPPPSSSSSLPFISSSSPSPPSPPSPPPREFTNNQVGPPGSMPPSDDIVDELNGSSDFLQVAQRLHLLRRLLQ